MKYIKIILADDHDLLMDGIASLLHDVPQFKVLAKASDVLQAMDDIKALQPDLVITDISMGEKGGLELTRFIASEYPLIKVIVLSMHDDVSHIGTMIDAGANGYLLKNVRQQELQQAIITVMEGGQYVQQSLSTKFAKAMQQDKQEKPLLSPREIEILRLIALEYSTLEISERLFLSPHTVETHRKNIIRKTKVKSVVGLINFGRSNGIL